MPSRDASLEVIRELPEFITWACMPVTIYAAGDLVDALEGSVILDQPAIRIELTWLASALETSEGPESLMKTNRRLGQIRCFPLS